MSRCDQTEEKSMSWLSFIPKLRSRRLFNTVLALAVVLALSGFLLAQQPGQKTFPTAEAASQALFSAAQAGDQSALLEVFGPAGSEIISSGDSVQDTGARDQFVSRYQEMHRLAQEPDGTTTLYIGAENWPVPIPLMNTNHSWYFDTAAGEEEIVYRRVGRNEMSAIRISQELVAAQKEYYAAQHN